MDAKCTAVQRVLSRADSITAVKIIKTFNLPEEEEECIILCDIRGSSLQQIADKLYTSPETVEKQRRSGYLKIVDALNL